MNNYFHYLTTLKILTETFQFKSRESDNIPNVRHVGRLIEYRKGTDVTNLWEFAHEIGHIICMPKINIKSIEELRTRNKLKVLIEEFKAWVIGYFICKTYRIDTKGFMKYASKCIGTYI